MSAAEKRAEQMALAPIEHSGELVAVPPMIMLALQNNVPPETLERLVALQERITDRNAEAALIEALAAFQAECPTLRKNKEVDYVTKDGARVRYRHASLDEIAKTIRPLLAKHGLSYSWDSSVDGGVLEVRCKLHHIEGASRTASFRCAIGDAGSSKMNGAQKAGAATSYGQRYSLVQVLGLTTAEDDRDAVGVGEMEEEAGAPSPVSVEQAKEIERLLGEAGADIKKFLDWFEVSAVVELPSSQYDRAVEMLKKVAAERAARSKQP